MKSMPSLVRCTGGALVALVLMVASCSPEKQGPEPVANGTGVVSEAGETGAGPAEAEVGPAGGDAASGGGATGEEKPVEVEVKPDTGQPEVPGPDSGQGGSSVAGEPGGVAPGTEGTKPEVKEPETPVKPEAEAAVAVPAKVELPAQGSEAWAELVKNSDFSVLMALLEAKAAESREISQRMAVVGAQVGRASGAGHTTTPELLSALDGLELLKLVPEVDGQWLKLQQAQAMALSGNTRESLKAVEEARRNIMKLMPPEMAPMWFTHADKSQKDENGDYQVRRTARGEVNDVFRPDETIHVAQRFRYLTGTEQPATGRYYYRIRVSAELLDEDGKKVENFKWETTDSDIERGLPPDQWETARQGYRLPNDIKAERDYVLRITVTDLLDVANERVTGEITVKVRNR